PRRTAARRRSRRHRPHTAPSLPTRIEIQAMKLRRLLVVGLTLSWTVPAQAQQVPGDTDGQPSVVEFGRSTTPLQGAVGEPSEETVPQTFDWWRSRTIPNSTPWGQPIDVS